MSADKDRVAVPEGESGLLNQSCFDLMLIELVPMAQRLAERIYTPTDSATPKPDEAELRDAVNHRLEALGYRVGLGLVESLSAQSPLPNAAQPLDTIKFLCKDLWSAVFRKQIDNLKTNHRGTFVLADNAFGPLRRASLPAGLAEEARQRVQPFLQFPTGLVRGALSALGMDAHVAVEVGPGGVPSVVVTIRVVGAKP